MTKEEKLKRDLDNAYAAILHIYQISGNDWTERDKIISIRSYISNYFEE